MGLQQQEEEQQKAAVVEAAGGGASSPCPPPCIRLQREEASGLAVPVFMERQSAVEAAAACGDNDSQVGRARDVLPLPIGENLMKVFESVEGVCSLSQSQARRRRRRAVVLREVERGVRALNALGGDGRAVPTVASLAQRAALQHLREGYAARPLADSSGDPLRAWQSLQGQRPGYADSVADDTRTSYQPGGVSLPRAGAGKVKLGDILPADL